MTKRTVIGTQRKDDMNCPDCGAAMDLRLTGTFNAHWECPFDQQVVWVEKWADSESDATVFTRAEKATMRGPSGMRIDPL